MLEDVLTLAESMLCMSKLAASIVALEQADKYTKDGILSSSQEC